MNNMNFTDLAQPTTVIGLAGIAIGALVYLTNSMTSRFTKHLEEKDKNYQDFVLERNHQTGEIIEKSTAVMVEVKDSIRQNTDSVRQLIEIHLKK